DNEWPLDWSKDGYLLYSRTNEYFISSDLFALPMTGDSRTPIVVASTSFEERMGDFSPDGRWVAYETDESGRAEVVVQAFPEPHGTVRVSRDGGSQPRWSSDAEINFIAPDGKMMAVNVSASGSTFNHGTPKALFPTQVTFFILKHQYTVGK